MNDPHTGSKALRIFLWISQILVAALFIPVGVMKLAQPIPKLAEVVPWAIEFPVWFVRSIGAIDLAGGIGILLPSLLRIMPLTAIWAAIGCACLQVVSIAFHLYRNEAAVIAVNVILLGLSVFVAWGRAVKAPIQHR